MHTLAINQTRRVIAVYAIFVILFFVGLVATFSNVFVSFVDSLNSGAPLTVIETRQDMTKAINAESAIIFAHMAASINSYVAKESFHEFVANWRPAGEMPNVQFFLLDSSIDDDELREFVDAWRETDHTLWGVGRIGMGEVVWMQNGKVLQVSAGLSALELSLETTKLLVTDREPK